VEYSVNDFALSQVAAGLGESSDAQKYLKRSQNWRNHWNPNATSLGFSGFVVPRNADGSFVPQDPLSCGGCYWDDAYYEALPWEYSHGMTHDVATLITYSGGPKRFVQRLEAMFTPGNNPANSTGTSQFNYTIFNPSNEPDFTTAYLYNFAGRQDLSVKRSRFIAKTYYNPSPTGLPGNSDAGAMQTWLLWNMIGLYPMTTMTTFLIHSPWFSTTINLGGGKELAITTQGGNSNTAYYVQSLYVNGKAWHKNWLTWNDVFANGGTMDFVLGAQPSSWFDGGALPPSPGSVTAS
jgi:predicted alpha-1,2-mannosidase